MAAAASRPARTQRPGPVWSALLAWVPALAVAQGVGKPVDPPADPPAQQRIEITAQPASDTDLRRRDPVAKTVIGREALEQYGDIAVSDVLKRLPGITMQGGSPRLRGLGAGYTLLLVNGEPAPPGFSLDTLSPGQVERIELTRGPSAEHSAQAVAGTVNIILREAPRSRQREARATLGWQAVRPTLSANGSWGDRDGALSYTLPLAVYQWRGQADSLSERLAPGPDGLPQRLRVPGEDQFWGEGFNLGPRLSWRLGAADVLEAQLFAQRHRYNSSGRFVTTVLEGLPPVSVDDHFVNRGHWQMARANAQWRHQGTAGVRLELKAGAQASSSRYRTLTDGLDGQGQPSLARDTSGHNLERSQTLAGKFNRPLGEAHTLALGWDAEQRWRHELRSVVENGVDQLPGFDGQPFEADLRRVALYAQDDWEITPRWATTIGLRAERLHVSSAGVDAVQHHRSQVVTPIWHLTHKLDAGGRDLVRASLTRSYKAPELAQLMGRPSLNSSYPRGGPNVPLSPDRIGNPALQPELATGLDLALETYLPQGGVLSLSAFHRRISGLIRNQVTLMAVPWAAVPRWVAQPVNLARARSTGLELELKGRATELLPAAGGPPGLSLRASLALYRSSVDGLPAPDNRLEQQQPWSATAGIDQVLGPTLGGPPLTLGASLAWTPGYRTQQTADQALGTLRTRQLDAYALWAISRQTSLRLAANNLLAQGSDTLTELLPDNDLPQRTRNARSGRRSFNASLSLKF